MDYMKYIIHIIVFGLMIPVTVFAQQKKLTIEEAVLKQRTTLAPDRLMQLQWADDQVYSYVVKSNGTEKVIQANALSGSVDTVFTLTDFQTLFKTLEIDIPPPHRLPFIEWLSKDEFRFMYSNAYYKMNIKTRAATIVTKVVSEAEEVAYNAISGRTAFVLNKNILCFNADTWKGLSSKKNDEILDHLKLNEKAAFITNDGTYGLVNGETVHRSEFGIHNGLFWSPNGNRLAYYKMQEFGVTDYELMNFNSKPGTFEKIKYPMAGASSHVVSVWVQDFDKNRQFEVQTAANADQYLTNIAWSPEADYIYIAVVNRDQNKMDLNQYDGRSGKFVKTLFTETHEKYVEPEHPVVFVKKDDGKFIWMSKRDGYNQLYLYQSNGKLVRQLTAGKFDVTELLGFDSTGKHAYYMAATNNGLDRQCYSVEIATGKTRLITLASGTHTVSLSPDGRYLIDTYSSTTVPRKSILIDLQNGSELKMLINAANPIADYLACSLRLGQLPASNGMVLNYRMFYPPQFDSTRKYPVLVYVYGGPHAQLVTNNWLGGADMWLYYMAQQGYVVFTLDNRGSGNRGRDFEQATFRKLGVTEREDQLVGISYLKKQPYVDASRLGVFGWSFGGFMTLGLMSKTEEFKVAVAGGPVTDWSLYEIMYTERYMDKPQENPEGYKESEMSQYAKNIKGKLMLIHGTDDDVVLWQHSLQYLKRCVDEGVQVDYFVYPEHKHNVTGKDRVHLMQKVTDYFKLHL